MPKVLRADSKPTTIVLYFEATAPVAILSTSHTLYRNLSGGWRTVFSPLPRDHLVGILAVA